MTENREAVVVHARQWMGRAGPVLFAVGVLAVVLLAGCSAPETPPAPEPPRRFDETFRAPLPRTLEESLKALEHTLPAKLQVKMRTGSEPDMIQHWFAVGRCIRNNWLMGNEPKPLRQWFRNEYGVRDAEDASWIILMSFWRHVNDRPLDVEGLLLDLHKQAEAQRVRQRSIGRR